LSVEIILLITEYKTFVLDSNSIHTLFVCFCDFFVGAQVISQAEAHGHRVMTFVPYLNVENWVTVGEKCMKILYIIWQK
jgi:hypothetical protein